jgi:hypothetical protein
MRIGRQLTMAQKGGTTIPTFVMLDKYSSESLRKSAKAQAEQEVRNGERETNLHYWLWRAGR